MHGLHFLPVCAGLRFDIGIKQHRSVLSYDGYLKDIVVFGR